MIWEGGFMVSCHDNILQVMPFPDANSLDSRYSLTSCTIVEKLHLTKVENKGYS